MTFDLLAEMERDGFSSSRKSASRSGQYNGPCILPSCSGVGNDRLRVQPNVGEYGWFACNVCGAKGTGIDYLILKRGLSKNAALQEVGWKPQDGSTPKFTIPRGILAGDRYPTHEAPPKAWQDAARAFAEYCEGVLWTEQGKAALEYLRARGLHDETIKAARLGYNPTLLRQSAEKWGREKHGKLGKGIVIPWYIGEDLWRITIRDENVAEGDSRYKQVAGGSNGLYLADSLHYERAVVLVEGEIDALSVAQECSHDVSVCATGTTQGSHTPKWVAALAHKELVFVAFDAEDKGDTAAQWWLSRLETAHRLRPWWKDANQMLQDGINLLNDWLLPALDLILDDGQSMMSLSDGYDKCYCCQILFPNYEGWDVEKIPLDDLDMRYHPANGELYCQACCPQLFEKTRQENEQDTVGGLLEKRKDKEYEQGSKKSA